MTRIGVLASLFGIEAVSFVASRWGLAVVFPILFRDDRRGLHDLAADTVVIEP